LHFDKYFIEFVENSDIINLNKLRLVLLSFTTIRIVFDTVLLIIVNVVNQR
jgi:hypothetical protein